MSKKLIDTHLQEILNLIDDKKWTEAEESLLELSKTGDSRAYYYLGHIYDVWDNPKKDAEKVKRYLNLAAESANPVAGAFIRLSRNEKNRTHSIRILRKGLQSLPKSEAIYYQLLKYTEPSERGDIYQEIIEQECASERIKINMAATYFDLKEYEKAIESSSGFECNEQWDRDILACIKGFSLYETGKSEEAGNIFLRLLEEDINHKLKYIPHFGLILALLSQDKLSKAEQLIGEIPLDANIYEGVYLGHWEESYIDAKEYLYRAINLIIKKTSQKKVMGIARGLRGLFFYSEAFDSEPIKKRLQATVRKDLEFAIKEFPQNAVIAEHLFWVYKEGNPTNAWKYLVQCVLNGGEDVYGHDDFIRAVDVQLFENFLKDFLDKSNNYYDAQKLSKFLLGPIIERLFKDKRYKDILITTSKFNDTLDLQQKSRHG